MGCYDGGLLLLDKQGKEGKCPMPGGQGVGKGSKDRPKERG